jgi:hypothetical protein
MTKEGFRLTRGAIRKINAVEGIPMERTDAIFAELDAWRDEGLTDAQIRDRIREKYGAKKEA